MSGSFVIGTRWQWCWKTCSTIIDSVVESCLQKDIIVLIGFKVIFCIFVAGESIVTNEFE